VVSFQDFSMVNHMGLNKATFLAIEMCGFDYERSMEGDCMSTDFMPDSASG